MLQLGQQPGAFGLQPAHALLRGGDLGVGRGLGFHQGLGSCLRDGLLLLRLGLAPGAGRTPEPTQAQGGQNQQGSGQYGQGFNGHGFASNLIADGACYMSAGAHFRLN